MQTMRHNSFSDSRLQEKTSLNNVFIDQWIPYASASIHSLESKVADDKQKNLSRNLNIIKMFKKYEAKCLEASVQPGKEYMVIAHLINNLIAVFGLRL